VTRIVFIAPNDWIIAACHLPVLRAAKELGLKPTVIAADWGRGRVLEQAGAQVISLPREDRPWRPAALARRARQLRAAFAATKPDILHLIGLGAAITGGAAAAMSGVGRRVNVISGLGALAHRQGQAGDAVRAALGFAAPLLLDGPQVRWLCEQADDARLLGLDAADPRVRIGGAGVDPLVHVPEPTPWMPPLRLAYVSALTAAKGLDVAVEALQIARRAGADVTLSIFGAPPKGRVRGSVSAEDLAAHARRPGVTWYGPADIAQVWRQHHALVMPSFGGEGLPRELLIAASSSRPAIASDVPGCRDIIRDGEDGLLVPARDAQALAAAMMRFVGAPGLVERMGRSAREQVIARFSERKAMDDAKAVWSSLLSVGLTA
jgi:glycosyltransferase involved in cell wall biosynthesis